MPGITLTLTTAGRQALVNAQNTGTTDLVINEIGVSAVHTAGSLAGLSILPDELKRLGTFAGDVVADDTLHVTIRDETADAYALRKFGLYLSNGVLFAVYSQSTPILEKSAAAMLLLAVDVILSDLTTANIAFGATNFVNPPATVETPGVVELATKEEAQAGVDAVHAVTPFGLKWVLDQLLPGKANVVHTHAAADIVSGVLAVARIPALAMSKITGLVEALDGKAAANHSHAAGDVITGVFDVARIPDLLMAKITGLVDALAGKAAAVHAHAGEDITSGTVADARLPGTMGGKTFTGGLRLASSVPTLEFAETDQANGAGRFMWVGNNGNIFLRRNTASAGDFSTFATELTIDPSGIFNFRGAPKVGGADVWHPGNFNPATKSDVGHTHAAGDVTSGVFAVTRIPDLLMSKITGLVDALAAKAAAVHTHAAADIVSGLLDVARIPDLAMIKVTGLAAALAGKSDTGHAHAAADVTSGVFDVLRIPDLAMARITGLVDALAAKAAAVHTHAATDIVSGVLAVARIPDLAISKITGLSAALTAATAAQFRANTGTQPLQPSSVWSAAQIVDIAQAATLTIDMSAGINFSTTMTGNRTLGPPANAKPGQSGILIITQDGAGFRTLAFDPAWKFAGGVDPTLSGPAGSRDVLCFTVVGAGDVIASLMKDVK